MSEPVYIIAEMSANHGGSFERAMAIVRAAKEAGADAIKLQTYTADTMTLDAPQEYFRIPGNSLWAGKTLHELYAQAMTPWEWHVPLQAEAKRLDLEFFSTPFDETAVDFLETLHVPIYKVASFELTDEPLLRRIAKTGRPVIMSTGLSSKEEIVKALSVLAQAKCGPVALLKCTSAYPATLESMNLKAIKELGYLFKVPVGLSDHSPGSVASIVAVSLGAVIIEKHLRIDDGVDTPDAAFSLTPVEFKQLVQDVRNASKVLGQPRIGRTQEEEGNARFRRSVFVTKDITAGSTLTKENIKVIRPGFGLSPSDYERVLGRTVQKAFKKGDPLIENGIQPVLNEKAQITLRPITADDSHFLFDLRNDDYVRAQSVHSNIISFESHDAWLQNRLNNPNSQMFIIENNKKKSLGQIRFDVDGEKAEVSIALIGSARGQGLGAQAIKEGSRQVFATAPVEYMKALIKMNNPGSIAAFLRAGFLVHDALVLKGEQYAILYLEKTTHDSDVAHDSSNDAFINAKTDFGGKTYGS